MSNNRRNLGQLLNEIDDAIGTATKDKIEGVEEAKTKSEKEYQKAYFDGFIDALKSVRFKITEENKRKVIEHFKK